MSERVPLQVLLVEDDEVDRQMVRRYIQQSGLRAELHEASSAEDAMLFCQKNTVDCVILDNRIPDGIGVNIAKQMFDQKGDRTPPIIMLTGAGNERVAVAALRTGIHDYLIKEEATPEILEEAILEAIKAKANARREFEQSLVLERQAVTDELTGLGNRRHFD